MTKKQSTSSVLFVKFSSENKHREIAIDSNEIVCHQLKDKLYQFFKLNPLSVDLEILHDDRSLSNFDRIPAQSFLMLKRRARNLPSYVEYRLRRMTTQSRRQQQQNQWGKNKEMEAALQTIVEEEKKWVPEKLTELMIVNEMAKPERQAKYSTAFGVPTENLKADDEGQFTDASGQRVSLVPATDDKFLRILKKLHLTHQQRTAAHDPLLQCTICQEELRHDRLTVSCCKSLYCSHCLLDRYSKRKQCPHCNHDLGIDDLKPVTPKRTTPSKYKPRKKNQETSRKSSPRRRTSPRRSPVDRKRKRVDDKTSERPPLKRRVVESL